MPKFRKKPVVIEAVQHDPHAEITTAYPRWFLDAAISGVLYSINDKDYVKTLEGDMLVSKGDWIIQGVKGELYPCKPDIFAATYEPAE